MKLIVDETEYEAYKIIKKDGQFYGYDEEDEYVFILGHYEDVEGEYIFEGQTVEDVKWKSSEDIEQEKAFAVKEAEHQEMKQIAEKLIMDRMVTDYILSTELSDSEKDIFINLFDLWKPDVEYSVGDKLVYEGLAYEVIQTHTSQSDWLPNELPALYKLFYQTSTDDGSIVMPEWKQPLGAHDAYNKWDLVTYEGDIWESNVDENIWVPGEYGWTMIDQ